MLRFEDPIFLWLLCILPGFGFNQTDRMGEETCKVEEAG